MSNLDDLLQTAASLSLGASDPYVAFASPIAVAGAALARMEGVVGTPEESVGEGTGDSKRVYPVVLVQGSDRTVCFGSVGVGSASFCIRKDCKVFSNCDVVVKERLKARADREFRCEEGRHEAE